MKKKRKPMKDLTVHLQSKTTRQFASRFAVALAEIPPEIDFFGGHVPGHALTCAAVLHFLEMGHEERNLFLRAYLKRYEEIVREVGSPGDGEATDPDGWTKIPGGGRAVTVTPVPAPKKASARKGKAGG